MKVNVYQSSVGIRLIREDDVQPEPLTMFLLGTLEVQEPKKETGEIPEAEVFSKISTRQKAVCFSICDSRCPCEHDQNTEMHSFLVPAGSKDVQCTYLPKEKKTVTKEARLVGDYSQAHTEYFGGGSHPIFSVPPLAKNIKCTYDIEE